MCLEMFRDVSKVFKGVYRCPHVSRDVQVFRGVQRCLELFRGVYTFLEVFKGIQSCSKVFGSTQTCSRDVSDDVYRCPDVFWRCSKVFSSM